MMMMHEWTVMVIMMWCICEVYIIGLLVFVFLVNILWTSVDWLIDFTVTSLPNSLLSHDYLDLQSSVSNTQLSVSLLIVCIFNSMAQEPWLVVRTRMTRQFCITLHLLETFWWELLIHVDCCEYKWISGTAVNIAFKGCS